MWTIYYLLEENLKMAAKTVPNAVREINVISVCVLCKDVSAVARISSVPVQVLLYCPVCELWRCTGIKRRNGKVGCRWCSCGITTSKLQSGTTGYASILAATYGWQASVKYCPMLKSSSHIGLRTRVYQLQKSSFREVDAYSWMEWSFKMWINGVVKLINNYTS